MTPPATKPGLETCASLIAAEPPENKRNRVGSIYLLGQNFLYEN
jgi:hypothetical protein